MRSVRGLALCILLGCLVAVGLNTPISAAACDENLVIGSSSHWVNDDDGLASANAWRAGVNCSTACGPNCNGGEKTGGGTSCWDQGSCENIQAYVNCTCTPPEI